MLGFRKVGQLPHRSEAEQVIINCAFSEMLDGYFGRYPSAIKRGRPRPDTVVTELSLICEDGEIAPAHAYLYRYAVAAGASVLTERLVFSDYDPRKGLGKLSASDQPICQYAREFNSNEGRNFPLLRKDSPLSAPIDLDGLTPQAVFTDIAPTLETCSTQIVTFDELQSLNKFLLSGRPLV